MVKIDEITSYGIDYDDAMDRFDGNVELYTRFALRYLDDSHFDGFLAAMSVGDYDTAFKEVHSLKGVAGNLSFAPLYTASSMACEYLRAGEPDPAAQMIPDVERAHHRIREGLLKL